jgi:cobalamin biosynthesis protein CobW
MTPRRTAACVVTGFLGSGKTTLLRGLLERDPARERIAVIVNELGEIGIDGRVLTGFEFIENIVELASGCVCCSIDEYRFDMAVEELVRRVDPQLIVLETSGIADPFPTLERLRRCGLGVDSVTTVVDATAWSIAWRVSRTARRQIAAADFLVISKCDLVSAARLRRLRGRLAKANARATVLESSGGGPFAGADLLLATSATRAAQREPSDSRQAEAGHSQAGHLDDEGFESLAWRTTAAVDRTDFERALAALPREVLRAKGFLRSEAGGTGYLFQLVCGRVEITGFEPGPAFGRGAEGVFIGRGIASMRSAIVARLAACELPEAEVARTD